MDVIFSGNVLKNVKGDYKGRQWHREIHHGTVIWFPPNTRLSALLQGKTQHPVNGFFHEISESKAVSLISGVAESAYLLVQPSPGCH